MKIMHMSRAVNWRAYASAYHTPKVSRPSAICLYLVIHM